MEQDITALKQSFEKEYRVFLADDRGNRDLGRENFLTNTDSLIFRQMTWHKL